MPFTRQILSLPLFPAAAAGNPALVKQSGKTPLLLLFRIELRILTFPLDFRYMFLLRPSTFVQG